MALLVGLSACAPGGGSMDSALASADPDRGFALYQQWCSSCHGAEGMGGSAASMFVVGGMSDAELADVILNGTDGMPPTPLSEGELVDLMAWIRGAF